MSIADNGPGIPAERQKRVFDPFYSTKDAGKGVGLGLWISYNIIKNMDGTITLESEPGRGATFTVAIPIKVPERR